MQLPLIDLTTYRPPVKPGVYLRYVSIMERYNNSSNQFILQDILEDGVDIKDALYRVLPEGSQVTGYPSCPCGHLKYGINQKRDSTVRCPKCYQPVQEMGGGSIDTLFWLGLPDHIKTFINPKLLIDLWGMKGLERSKFNPWRFLMDPTYKPKSSRALKDPLYIILDNKVSDGLVRGYNYFAAHLRSLIPMVFETMIETTRKADVRRAYQGMYKDIKVLLAQADDKLYSAYLPILNSALLQIEQIGNSTFKAETTDLYGRAITTIALLERGNNTPLTSSLEKKLSKEMSDLYVRLTEAYLLLMKSEGQKPGTIKMDILGSRSDMTFRGVITPITALHHPDECWIPWSFGITLLSPHLIGRLGKLGYTENEAINFLADHTVKYDSGLEILMNDIVEEYCKTLLPDALPGIPISLIRYPTMEVHSNQLLRVTKIKTNPRDFALCISPHSLPGYRGDNDGDELTGQVIQDIRVLQTYSNNHISKNALDVSAAYRFGRATELPAPVIQAYVGYCTIYPDM